jgi:U32 family peptidase
MKQPELRLAPAGSLEAFFAAMENGADAVYCGLRDFSARAKAKNFAATDLERMLNYAQAARAQNLCHRQHPGERARIAAIGGDPGNPGSSAGRWGYSPGSGSLATGATALSRPGAARLHPDDGSQCRRGTSSWSAWGLPGAYWRASCRWRKLPPSANRRTLNWSTSSTAPCASAFPGSATFSSWLGGKSGNRGRCAQPCRRRYRYHNQEGYFFSPNDLSAIDLLPELSCGRGLQLQDRRAHEERRVRRRGGRRLSPGARCATGTAQGRHIAHAPRSVSSSPSAACRRAVFSPAQDPPTSPPSGERFHRALSRRD